MSYHLSIKFGKGNIWLLGSWQNFNSAKWASIICTNGRGDSYTFRRSKYVAPSSCWYIDISDESLHWCLAAWAQWPHIDWLVVFQVIPSYLTNLSSYIALVNKPVRGVWTLQVCLSVGYWWDIWAASIEWFHLFMRLIHVWHETHPTMHDNAFFNCASSLEVWMA